MVEYFATQDTKQLSKKYPIEEILGFSQEFWADENLSLNDVVDLYTNLEIFDEKLSIESEIVLATLLHGAAKNSEWVACLFSSPDFKTNSFMKKVTKDEETLSKSLLKVYEEFDLIEEVKKLYNYKLVDCRKIATAIQTGGKFYLKVGLYIVPTEKFVEITRDIHRYWGVI